MSVLRTDPASEFLRYQVKQAEAELEVVTTELEALALRRQAGEQGRARLQDAILSFQAALSHLADMPSPGASA